VNAGKNHSGDQRCFCKECRKYYTLNPKTRKYSEEIRRQAIKTFYAGVSDPEVGNRFSTYRGNLSPRMPPAGGEFGGAGAGRTDIYRKETAAVRFAADRIPLASA